MVNTETFQQITWDDIPWEEEGVLYRGCVESDLVSRLANNFLEPQPSYYGFQTYFPSKEKFTFTRTNAESVLYYLVKRTEERGSQFFSSGFNPPWNKPVHPLLIKINARLYRHNLGICARPNEQDGFIIRGGVNPADIEILYSSRICKIIKICKISDSAINGEVCSEIFSTTNF